ncbi:MAG TPA: ATP-binding protein [Ktedonobacteraceae bacterium]|nr:ATP-binding protein [Ktedonobacteraceae bacterium]
MAEQMADSPLSNYRPHLGKRLRFWFVNNTFAPSWLPERLQHPFLGYLIAVFLQIIAVLVTYFFNAQLQVFTIAFAGLLEILVIALVALSWGVGPSVVATLVGACLFDYLILAPHPGWEFSDPRDGYQLLLFVLVGLAISIVSSQTELARRRAERLADSLTKEHARLEAIIETVPDIVAIYDRRGRMTHMNDIGRHNRIFDPDMRNHSLEELFRVHEAFTLDGKPVQADDLPMVHALRGETVEGQEIRFFTSEGSECFLSISAAPMRNIRGKIDGVVAVTRDLSALHQSEREAANRAIELEAILQSLADGFYVVDPDGNFIRSNAAFMEIIGCTEENKASFFALSYEERQAQLDMRDEQGHPLTYEAWPEMRILRGEVLKDSASVDLQLRNLNGRELQVNVSGAPLYNREGELIAALCVCHDVTERRKLEQRTHDALDALLTMAEALVIRSDKEPGEEENRMLSAKKIARRMARLTSSVLGCQRVSIFLVDRAGGALRPMAMVGFLADEEERQWVFAEQAALSVQATPIAQAMSQLQAGKIVVLDTQAETSHWGPPFSLVPTALLVPMSVGEQLIGLLVLAQAEAETVYTEENIALAGAVAQLLALVFERERLLHERAESQATELALRAANRHMEEFLGMVSHELKTPLTSIKGNTQLAIRQLRTSMQTFERILGLYESADQQSRRLNRLVDDLLDVSRAQAGHLELIPGPCDLRTLVHEALQEQRKMWPGRTIELEMDEGMALPLEADADRIVQVISNYLTNALKYSDPDRPVYVIAQRERSEVYLAVRDEGPGLPEDEQERIWTRFHRASDIEVRSSAHTSQSGLGLGLYISKTVIEGQQGRVGVRSQRGAGSTFWFRLPLSSMNIDKAI